MTNGERESLIRVYLDGSATDEQVRELDQLLAADAAARRELLGESAFDAQVRVVLQRQAELRVAVGRKSVRPRFVIGALAVAAGLVLAVGVAWYAGTARPPVSPARVVVVPGPAIGPAIGPIAPAVPPAPVIPAPEVVGMLTRIQGAVSLVSPHEHEGVAARS